MRIFTLAILAFGACFGQAQLQPGQPLGLGSISGKAQGEDGTAIVDALVTVTREMEATNTSFKRFTKGERTRADGAFSFDRLGAGLYRLCAETAHSVWLDPCEWGKPLLVRVVAGPTATEVAVSMKRGVAFPVRVDDPGGLLSQHEGKTPGAHLLIGVGNDAGMFRPVAIVARDGNGRDYQILIPVGVPVKLVISSRFFKLADDKGNAIASTGVAVTVLVPAGQIPNPLKLKIVGTNP